MSDTNPLPESGQTYDDADAFACQLADNRRLLGMDLGTKTIGLALSDVQRTIASSLETIRRKKFSVDALVLLRLVEEHDIAGFVLGLPVNLNGTEGPRAQATRSFARHSGKERER